jgi:hypothetical protein
MANKAYRSIATGNWSNPTGTVWAVYSGTWNSSTNSFNSGGWSTAAANDYPTADDFVWIQGANVVTYDTTAISGIGTGILKQISRQTAAHVSYAGTVAQPTGTGPAGSDATTGYIAISTTGVQSLRANYYIIGTGFTGSTGMFTVSNSTITLNIGASSGVSSFCEGTGTSVLLFALTSLTSITVNMTSTTDLKVGGSRTIALGSSITLNIYTTTIDLTSATASYIDCTGQSPSVNIYGSLQGTNSTNASLAIWCITSTGAPTITVSGNCLSGTTGGCISVAQNATNYVQVGGNIRNYGLSGSTPTGLVNAIVGTSIRLTSTGSEIYYNIGGEAKFVVGGTSISTAEQYWAYLTTNTAFSTTDAIGKLIKDNLNATVSSRATQTSVDTLATYVDTEVAAIKTATDRIPLNPASIESTGDQIAAYNT